MMQTDNYLLKLIREQKQISPVKALIGNKVIKNNDLYNSYEEEIEKVQKEIGKRNVKKFNKKEMKRYLEDKKRKLCK